MGKKKTKLMLYSTLVEIEFEVRVELGNRDMYKLSENSSTQSLLLVMSKISLSNKT